MNKWDVSRTGFLRHRSRELILAVTAVTGVWLAGFVWTGHAAA